MITYLLTVSLCWLIFYLLYYFWLSKETFFHLNRWYLLGTLLLGMIIPILPSPFGAGVQESEWVTLYVAPISYGLENLQVTVSAPTELEQGFDWWALFAWMYWGGVIFTSIRFLSGLWRIASLYLRAEHIKVGKYSVALTDEAHLPFSFFKVIFKSKLGALDEFAEEKINDHELAHVRGWHTIDVLLVELVSIFLWCSPPVHLYRHSLRIVHEYIADSAAIRPGEKKKYGHLLIRQSQSGLQLALANHFIQSQLKKRIVMITKTRSGRQAFLKYLPAIPLLVVVLVIFSNWDAVANDSMNLLDNEVIDGVEVIAPSLAEDFDPKVLQKTLSAILYKRSQVTTNQDAKLARGFAKVHDEWAAKYPDHQDEIRKIAEEVAEQYELALEFDKGIINTAFFKKPFKKIGEGSGIELNNDSEKEIELNTPSDKDPYVVIDDQPAPADWKANLKPEAIASIDVLKDEAALKAYGEKGKDGVVRIYTKAFAKEHSDSEKEIKLNTPSDKDPYVVIDDQPAPADWKANVKPETIASIDVLKGEAALKAYGEKGKDGVVRIYTKAFAKENKDAFPTREEEEKVADESDPKIIIRKLEDNNNKPLFLIDGEMMKEGSVNDLDPNEIESIEVLKGEKAIAAYGQKGTNGVVKITTKSRFYDTAPIFPGCEELDEIEKEHCSGKSFLEKIYRNITYPATARAQQIEGTVVIKYTIAADGSIKKPKVVRGIGGGCDEAALSVFQHIPNNWKPATKDGKAIAVEMLLPISYRLEDKGSSSKVTKGDTKEVLQKLKSDKSKVADEVVVVGYRTQIIKDEVFKVVEEMPRFPGCETETDLQARKACADKTMLEFVYKNLKYTKAAKDAGKEGMVIANFVVTKNGEITDATIVRSLGYGLDEQVLEVIKKMPTLIPGKQKGKVVDVSFNLPIRFMLGKEDASTKESKREPTTVHVNGPTEQAATSPNTLALQNFKAAPNPSNGLINLRFQAEARPLSVRILSANGQEVYKNELPQFGGNFDEQIDLQDVPKGTFFISVLQGDKLHTSTIILQ